MIYWVFYILMLIGFSGLGLIAPDIKSSGLIFWRVK